MCDRLFDIVWWSHGCSLAGTKRVHAMLSWRRVRALRSLRRAFTLGRRVGWSSIMSSMVHGQNKLSRRCDKSGNDVRLMDCTPFIPGKTQLDAYAGERWSCCTTVLALRFASCHGESNEGIRAHCCRPR